MPQNDGHISVPSLTAFAHGWRMLTKSESYHFDRCPQCYKGLKEILRRIGFVPTHKSG
jgi:hypothetical protein